MAPSYSLLRGGHGTNCAADSDDGECRVIFLVQSSMFVNKDKITLLAGLIPKLYLLAKLWKKNIICDMQYYSMILIQCQFKAFKHLVV